ncbi:polysaccharide biosynthesis protein [Paenibacillus sp. PAMC21692]|uniref:putative polysaccharide biosynthesis protein n=1 Tax=Paenibacillus sp. PAMC21692 TaxID=2762320 RepID=UPI00164CFEA5|nr:polysaccharide biosynthesis protein [Paenibacillus sp. PAMC21692]QNK56184.1 polysaccharide biosynthesis protein [Paenibacillus sp. PAMC21692]
MVKKDTLIKGTIILAAAALIARFLGLFQKIPLAYMLDHKGMVAFNAANSIYLVLLLVATAGFPSAISKMVSERYALGKEGEARRIYHAALVFGAVSGLILAVALFALAPVFAVVSKEEYTMLSVRAIAPALLVFPVIAMMRGYFQGRQFMTAGGTSQIVEQLLRVGLGIGLGLIVLALDWGDNWVAATVTFGSVFGAIGAFAVMLRFARKLKVQDASTTPRFNGEAAAALMRSRSVSSVSSDLRFRSIYAEIFKMSLPALVTSTAINLIFAFDQTLFLRLTGEFYSAEAGIEALADFGAKAISLAGIPPILAIALGSSLIPVIAAAYKLKNMGEVQRQASVVMRVVCFTGVPLALLFTVAAYSIIGVLFPLPEDGSGPTGSGAVAALAAGTILQITMMTTNSILYGMGKQRISMRHTLIGLVLKVVVSVALAPFLGVYGLIIGSTVCFVVTTMMNLRFINGIVKLKVLGKRWMPYLVSIAVAALGGWGAETGMLSLTDSWIPKLSYFFAAAAASIAVVALYGAMLVILKVVTAEDAASLPARLRKPFLKVLRIVSRA